MEATKFIELIEKELKPYYESDQTLKQVVFHRRRMEALLLIPLSSMLQKQGIIITPNYPFRGGNIDLQYDDTAIELKAFPTGYAFKNIPNKSISVSDIRDEILFDIHRLKTTSFKNRYMMFLVYPVNVQHEMWKGHIQLINRELNSNHEMPFMSCNEYPCCLYFGSC